MSLKGLAEEAKCNFDDSNKTNLLVFHALGEIHSSVMLGKLELSLIIDDYLALGSQQKDLITNALIAEGFNAYFIGSTLRVFWEDATQGIAKTFLDSIYTKLDHELFYLIEHTVKTTSCDGLDGCYFYLDDEDFKELLSKYPKKTILRVLRKHFRVTQGSLQEIYVSWR